MQTKPNSRGRAKISVNLRAAWSPGWVLGQSGKCRKTLSQKLNQNKKERCVWEIAWELTAHRVPCVHSAPVLRGGLQKLKAPSPTRRELGCFFSWQGRWGRGERRRSLDLLKQNFYFYCVWVYACGGPQHACGGQPLLLSLDNVGPQDWLRPSDSMLSCKTSSVVCWAILPTLVLVIKVILMQHTLTCT